MKWINVHISGRRAKVQCPKCRMLFIFDAFSFKDERRRWKCCPICKTPIERYTPRAMQPRKPAADEEGQGGTP